jgi:hypothetical protein
MRNPTTNEKLELTWVQVRDADGRTRMEAHWKLVPVADPASAPASAPHAA